MQRLTLIFSDLFVPEEAARERALQAPLDLPNLDWLLRYAAERRPVGDWRRWLCEELGQSALAGLPPAHLVAHRAGHSLDAGTWLATPLRLEARLDHVRLVDRGLLRIEDDERDAWCAEFARHFGPTVALHPGNARCFILTGVNGAEVRTQDPARLLDMDIGASLPAGKGAGELRRLGAEIDMWLHSSALNEARERNRRPRISSLWLWGGGAASASMPTTALSADVALQGQDPWLAALAEAGGREVTRGATDFASAGNAAHVVAEFAPMSGAPDETLPRIDAHWLAPARAALSRGELHLLEIVANDRCFRIRARPAWRVWRRPRRWFEYIGNAKA